MNENGIIYGGASVGDVRAVLGEYSTSVLALCKSPKINRRARCKPYAFGGLSAKGLTDLDRRAHHFGLTAATVRLPDAKPPTVALETRNVGFVQPGWGQAALPDGHYPDRPCRLGDYLGYDHRAVGPVKQARLRTTAGYGHTNPIWGNGMPGAAGYIIAELTLDPKAGVHLKELYDAEGRRLGGLWLTVFLVDADTKGRTTVYVGQSDLTLDECEVYDGHASETMTAKIKTTPIADGTLNIPGELPNDWESYVVMGLCERIDTDTRGAPSDKDFALSQMSRMASLDVFAEASERPGDFFTCAYNSQAGVYGDGATGGENLVDVQPCRGEVGQWPWVEASARSTGGLIFDETGVSAKRGTITVTAKATSGEVVSWLDQNVGWPSLWMSVTVKRRGTATADIVTSTEAMLYTSGDGLALTRDQDLEIPNLGKGAYEVEVRFSIRSYTAIGLGDVSYVDAAGQPLVSPLVKVTGITIE